MQKFIKVSFSIVLMTLICLASYAQQDARPRKSPKASVTQRVGADTDIVINYNRPGVKGRKVWGDMVPYGMYPGNQYSKDKPFPWRAGADENSTISFNKDLMIEGKKIPAGKYSIHMLAGEREFKVMFNTASDGWGSYAYDASLDALVITVKPVAAEHTEWLEFGFKDLTDDSATAYLRWEKLEEPFKIQLAK